MKNNVDLITKNIVELMLTFKETRHCLLYSLGRLDLVAIDWFSLLTKQYIQDTLSKLLFPV